MVPRGVVCLFELVDVGRSIAGYRSLDLVLEKSTSAFLSGVRQRPRLLPPGASLFEAKMLRWRVM
jgi:hypothetical protein